MTIDHAQLADQLRRLGYAIIPGVLTDAECGRYKQLLEEIWSKFAGRYTAAVNPEKLNNQGKEKMCFNLHNKDISFCRLIDHQDVTRVIYPVMQKGSYKNSVPITCHACNARTPLKNAGYQQLHVDARTPVCDPPQLIGVFWLIDDYTEDNGATRVVPGSHLYSHFPESGKIYPEEIKLCAPKGSVVLYDAHIWHGGGENTTADTRWALLIQYTPWFYKSMFDFNRNMPREIHDQLNDEQKRLFGYFSVPPRDEFERIDGLSNTPSIPEDYLLTK